jgi:hypothetical protein
MMRALARAALIVACCTTTAQAQLGNLIKKAKDAVTKQSDQPKGTPLAGEPVNGSTLDKLLAGLAVFEQESARGAQAGKALRVVTDEMSKLRESNSAAIAAWEKSTNATRECVSAVMEERNKAHQPEMQAKTMSLAADQAALQKYVALTNQKSQEYAQAMAKNDTVRATKALAEMYLAIGIDINADSAIAFQRCGRPPARLAVFVQLSVDGARADSLRQVQREVEAQADKKAAAASGLPFEKFANARERVLTWFVRTRKGGPSGFVTSDEESLFKRRLSELESHKTAFEP